MALHRTLAESEEESQRPELYEDVRSSCGLRYFRNSCDHAGYMGDRYRSLISFDFFIFWNPSP